MKTFISVDFPGHWPVGTAAVILADSLQDAEKLLSDKLAQIGLPAAYEDFSVREITLRGAYILRDGNY